MYLVIATGKDTSVIANEKANFKLLSEKVGIGYYMKKLILICLTRCCY